MRILLLDIETFPNVGYTWAKWEQNVLEFKEHWYILSVGYKWFGEKRVRIVALPDFKGYKAGGTDKELVKYVWDLLDQAEIVIAQNGDDFDIKKINTRFIEWGLTPPSPYKTIDTLKVAKRYFSFNSNKLDDLGRDLGIGRKMEHEGFPLWLRCAEGDKKAWSKMERYNKKDVELLEQLYIKERPYIRNHPNLDAYTKDKVCPTCGEKALQSRGTLITQTMSYNRYCCGKCGAWIKRVKDGVRVSYNKQI